MNDDDDDSPPVVMTEQLTHLNQLRDQLNLERKQLESERKQFEFEKKSLETERSQFESEKKLFQKQKERLEQERMNHNEGTPTSPQKVLTTVQATTVTTTAESESERESYQKLFKDYEDLRRENIGYQLEIEKGKKTLETEKNVTSLPSPLCLCLSHSSLH
jgi:chromosome segregation ATPase